MTDQKECLKCKVLQPLERFTEGKPNVKYVAKTNKHIERNIVKYYVRN